MQKRVLEKEKKHDFSKYFSMQCQISLVSPLKTRLEEELNIIQVQYYSITPHFKLQVSCVYETFLCQSNGSLFPWNILFHLDTTEINKNSSCWFHRLTTWWMMKSKATHIIFCDNSFLALWDVFAICDHHVEYTMISCNNNSNSRKKKYLGGFSNQVMYRWINSQFPNTHKI